MSDFAETNAADRPGKVPSLERNRRRVPVRRIARLDYP